MFAINNILRSIHRIQDPNVERFNILTVCINSEKYINLLAQTGHNFYILPQHSWNNLIEAQPSNVQTLQEISEPLDYIVCYNRAEQYDEMKQVSLQLHVPIIFVDMCSKPMIRPQHILEIMNPIDTNVLNRPSILHIYNDKHIQQSWQYTGASLIIPMGIDINKFTNQSSTEQYISLDNNTEPKVGGRIVAATQNLYPVLPTDHDDTTISVNQSRYFINTYKNITVKTLEAMAAENIVICLKNDDTSSFIQHQHTGILIDTIDELSNILTWLEQDKELRITIAKNARQKIIADHTMESFIQKWNIAFNMLKSTFYTPTPTL